MKWLFGHQYYEDVANPTLTVYTFGQGDDAASYCPDPPWFNLRKDPGQTTRPFGIEGGCNLPDSASRIKV